MDILFGFLGFALGIAIAIVASSLYSRKSGLAALISVLVICGTAMAVVITEGRYAAAVIIGALAGVAAMVMLTLMLVGIHIYLLKTDSEYRLKAALNRLRRY